MNKFIYLMVGACFGSGFVLFCLLAPSVEMVGTEQVEATAKTTQLSAEEMKSLGVTPADTFLAVVEAKEGKEGATLRTNTDEALSHIIHEVMTQMEFATEKGDAYVSMEMENSRAGRALFDLLKDKLERSGYIVERNWMGSGGRRDHSSSDSPSIISFGYVVALKK